MNYEILIEALETLIEKQKNHIENLDARDEEKTSCFGFVLCAICDIGAGRQLLDRINKRNEAGSFELTHDQLRDIKDYLENNTYQRGDE